MIMQRFLMIQNKSVLAIIPARGGSKSIPRKNLRRINGESLLARTIATVQQSTLVDRIIVSSEDHEIIEAAQSAGAEVPFIRPLELAKDETSGNEPILHALTQLPNYDYIVVLQVTSPLRLTSDIDACLTLCLRRNAPACISVCESEVSPYWMFTMYDSDKLTPLLPDTIPTRRQDLPVTYVLNGAIYVAKSTWYMQKKSFISNETIGYIMPKERSLDIDTEFDFQLLDLYLRNSIYHEKYNVQSE